MDQMQSIRSFVTGEIIQMRNIHGIGNDDFCDMTQTHSFNGHHHRHSRRKKRDSIKQAYFEDLNELCKIIRDGIEYPKLLHGLYYRPTHGFDFTFFVLYEEFVNRMYSCVHKMESLDQIDQLESLY
ncbi:hypothetical protein RFI_04102 [Reticulomyxa filosa]|uniref:Uncharacterized protein n=1 Tax=Reticulomyxa filosa TaxID=46433 RepID=X6P386_RETFI|nr:hypothetical protein RFI_04102 [Reticulomyxa filosa]|eukprot:ETO33000.1 hypothetical protein RFI_04102 [Reticulomyxa filosa]